MHSREQRATEDASNSQHMEWMHKDIMFRLKDKHIVESTGDTEWHSVREGSLSKGIDKKDGSRCCNRCRVSNKDPGTHP